MTDCHVCGNEIDSGLAVCPFCETRQEKQATRVDLGYKQKSINLEVGRPFVEAAITKLRKNIEIAKAEDVRVLTVIHGYGSSGKGGKIRMESRKMLDFLMQEGDIQSYITGEEFHRRAGSVKIALRRYPGLAKHKHLNRRNPGITIVIL